MLFNVGSGAAAAVATAATLAAVLLVSVHVSRTISFMYLSWSTLLVMTVAAATDDVVSAAWSDAVKEKQGRDAKKTSQKSASLLEAA